MPATEGGESPASAAFSEAGELMEEGVRSKSRLAAWEQQVAEWGEEMEEPERSSTPPPTNFWKC